MTRTEGVEVSARESFRGAKGVSRSDEFRVAEKDEKDFAKTCGYSRCLKGNADDADNALSRGARKGTGIITRGL